MPFGKLFATLNIGPNRAAGADLIFGRGGMRAYFAFQVAVKILNS